MRKLALALFSTCIALATPKIASASLLVGRVNPWWLRLASPPTSGA